MENLILILQITLACVFLYFGLMKIVLPAEKIEKKVTWAQDYSSNRLKLFGFIEVIGALGLVVPTFTGILPIVTPMAATGLAMVMAGAIVVHLSRDEIKMVILNIVIIFLLAGIGFNTLFEVFQVG